jgi:hypothetical protein
MTMMVFTMNTRTIIMTTIMKTTMRVKRNPGTGQSSVIPSVRERMAKLRKATRTIQTSKPKTWQKSWRLLRKTGRPWACLQWKYQKKSPPGLEAIPCGPGPVSYAMLPGATPTIKLG